MNIINDDSMETAIEPENQQNQRRPGWLRKIRYHTFRFLDCIGSENFLFTLMFCHWIISCMLHMTFSDRSQVISEIISFLALVYFLAMLLVFISILSGVNSFLVPLGTISFCVQLFLIYLIVSNIFGIQNDNPISVIICSKNPNSWTCNLLSGNGGILHVFALTFALFFYTATIFALSDQAARNSVARQRHILRDRNLMMWETENVRQPVGPVNLDEPPRYSTLEHPSTPQRQQSIHTETSPPRYSYWERTFNNPKRSTDTKSTTSPKNV
ncbi:unnamed protein product [Caenorhabditis angaria]|uniref:Uncharacterized protein n=1 Tax=Caenorhabditis angaria TaxID=860376 RepID=A0A9P1MWY3_9PELO|nr:unnamed protein product [Caenorhabditis angaria]